MPFDKETFYEELDHEARQELELLARRTAAESCPCGHECATYRRVFPVVALAFRKAFELGYWIGADDVDSGRGTDSSRVLGKAEVSGKEDHHG